MTFAEASRCTLLPRKPLAFAQDMLSYVESPGQARGSCEPLGDKSDVPAQPEMDSVSSDELFPPSAQAPQRPANSDSFVGQNIVLLSGVFSSSAANKLLEFMREDANTFLSKINTTKFTIKASSFSSGTLACELKVYIFSRGLGETSVEFQRRGGDAISFNTFYRRARACLLNRHQESESLAAMMSFSTGCSEDALELPLPICDGVELLQPLLVMASCVTSMTLQAEAAAGLAAAASSKKQGHDLVWTHLHDPEVQSALSQLNVAHALSVWHPVSHLLGATDAVFDSLKVPTFVLGR